MTNNPKSAYWGCLWSTDTRPVYLPYSIIVFEKNGKHQISFLVIYIENESVSIFKQNVDKILEEKSLPKKNWIYWHEYFINWILYFCFLFRLINFFLFATVVPRCGAPLCFPVAVPRVLGSKSLSRQLRVTPTRAH